MNSSNPNSDSASQDQSAPVRYNETLIAPYERLALQCIARRLPTTITPDFLTALGVFGALIVIGGYALSRSNIHWMWLANLGLVVHWLGDSLDGTVARFRKIERPRYGFYLDQVIDTVGNTLIALGVGLSLWMRMDLVLLVLALYHMLSIQVYVRAIVDREFHMAVGRLGPTEMRISIVGLNCVLMYVGRPQEIAALGGMTWTDVMLLSLSAALFVLFVMQMRGHLARFAAEDPGPKS